MSAQESPIPFLKAVALAYAYRSSNGNLPLHRCCFIFPNKRAGTFFLRHLSQALPHKHIAPEITTISDFTERLSGLIIDSRLDLIFLLHRCYCRLLAKNLDAAEAEPLLSFDSFRRWGDAVLNDFNEVDMHLADPDEIFKNLKDFREISSSFLTDAQREVLEKYFGYHDSDYDPTRFWRSFGEDPDDTLGNRGISELSEITESQPHATPRDGNRGQSVSKAKFIHIWKVLAPLYHSFHDALAKRGLTTVGGAYRLSVENLTKASENGTLSALVGADKLIFVGFNALSASEREIFSILHRAVSPAEADSPLADFIWDSTGPVLRDTDNSAGRFVAFNRRRFPEPEWIRIWLAKSDTSRITPEIRTIAAPSKSIQIKLASAEISSLHKKIGDSSFERARVAMILPDESLLLPLLHSIPEDINDVNLTMGYPLRLTSVTSFLSLLRRLQTIRRDSKKYQGYIFEEVRNLLAHPFAQTIIGSDRIHSFCEKFESRHISVVRSTDLSQLGDAGERMLRPLSRDATPTEVIGYIDDVLRFISESLQHDTSESNRLELHHIAAWRDALIVLKATISRYDVKMNIASTMAEASRLLQGETVTFEGMPLKGLQIMGMLETRALDFEHIVIVGVNDRILPRRSRRHSFLPNVIRHGYGLPPIGYQESIFAYYFFRLISRAKSVTMIYDNRASGRSGGPSRYLLQLKHIYARDRITHIPARFNLSNNPAHSNSVKKTPEVMERLERYRNEAPYGERRKNFSASLLKRYAHCPLQFYYTAVLDIADDPEPTDAISNITYGNIIHGTLEHLYLPDREDRNRLLSPPKLITSEAIDAMLNSDDEIEACIRKIILHDHFNEKEPGKSDITFEPGIAIVADVAKRHIKNVLRHDRTLTPFHLYGCEVKGDLDYAMPDGTHVNFTYAIDRIDDALCADSPESLRVVDYKSGGYRNKAASLDSLFKTQSYTADHVMQLLGYSLFLNLKLATENRRQLDIKPMIYYTTNIHVRRKLADQIPLVAGTKVDFTSDRFTTPEGEEKSLDTLYREWLENCISEIFDPEKPFAAEYSESRCRFCPFRAACGYL